MTKTSQYPAPFVMPKPTRQYSEPSPHDRERIAKRKRYEAIQEQRELDRINREAYQIG